MSFENPNLSVPFIISILDFMKLSGELISLEESCNKDFSWICLRIYSKGEGKFKNHWNQIYPLSCPERVKIFEESFMQLLPGKLRVAMYGVTWEVHQRSNVFLLSWEWDIAGQDHPTPRGAQVDPSKTVLLPSPRYPHSLPVFGRYS